MSQLAYGLINLIGNTPLIRLQEASELTGCEIYAKAEFMNPGGSVKDRTAWGIVRDALNRKELKPGGRIVEGTAGNTGIGLSLVANALGLKTTIVMPETQSQEKKDILRLLGAELKLVPAVPLKDDNHYTKVSKRLAEEYAGKEGNTIWANQFNNQANRQIHMETTGEEIWRQTEGKVDAFCCAVGTGGTLAGVAQALRKHKPEVKIFLSDPMGASLYHYYLRGRLESEGGSVMEGIGQSRITANLEDFKPDGAFQIPDEEALPYIFALLKNEGIAVGGSSGINIAGAVRVARELGTGHTIVTVLCDIAGRYQSKLFNPEFLKEKKLPVPGWL
ncbi:cysteine synthase A [Neptuniibacter sp.]|uniref:cysteine synthase A n=1 Tax=Neptuniibacter sp. TaxID=1962643 RepID=UPI00261F37BE|nr:cysteine synthase A [Neptuniibacter sp.]MCP4595242.1 cysteine synthase A [Neptuniibacter sp.]